MLSLFAQADKNNLIRIRADEWCPYNCSKDRKEPGYVLEIFEYMAKKFQYKIDYEVMPWSRSLSDARDGKIESVIGAIDGDKDGLIFTEAIGNDTDCIYGLSGKPVKSVEDLHQFDSIGTVIDYVYQQDMMNWMTKNSSKIQSVAGTNPLSSNIKKVLAGRISAFIENQAVADYYLKENSEYSKIKNIGCLTGDLVYVGFSKKNPLAPTMVKHFNLTLFELRKTGKLKKILDKYNAPIF